MAKLYFYYEKNPLQWLLSSRLNVVLNYEDSFVFRAKDEMVKVTQAGNTSVQISIPYFGSEIGKVKEDFIVNEDDIVHITYKSPFLVFSAGTIFVEKGEKRSKIANNFLGSFLKIVAFIIVLMFSMEFVLNNIISNIPNQNVPQNQHPETNEIETPQDSYTVNQRNAIRKAKTYLQVMPFSRAGLITQLEYEGFETTDATFGVDNIGTNWSTQAELKAAQYLKIMAYSKIGLIQQLEYEGFSNVEAISGVNNLSVNWSTQAELKAAQYLKIMAYSKSGLIQQLEHEGFTKEEAEHGVESTGLR